MARPADEAQFAADKRQSLSHAGMAKARPSLLTGWIESNAVVAHRELESVVDRAKADVYRGRARMTCDIPQRFLRDAVQTEC
jgi:hypothetical protein